MKETKEVRCPKDNTLVLTWRPGANGTVVMDSGETGALMKPKPSPDGKHNLLFFICPKCGTEVLAGSMPKS